jgi:hypothetical protein
MASPAMLRGVFGRSFKGWHIPDEVLEEIFKFGFHLWLAVPCYVLEDGDEVNFEGLWTTRVAVYPTFLTQDARRLVEYGKYEQKWKLQYDWGHRRPLIPCSEVDDLNP